MERKAIFVPAKVHKEVKVLAAKEGIQMNELIEKAVLFYKANK